MWDLPVHDPWPGFHPGESLPRICMPEPISKAVSLWHWRAHESPTWLSKHLTKSVSILLWNPWVPNRLGMLSIETHSSHRASVISRGVRGVGGFDFPEASTFGSAWPEPLGHWAMLFRRGPYGTMFFKFVCIALDDLPKVQRLLSLSSSLLPIQPSAPVWRLKAGKRRSCASARAMSRCNAAPSAICLGLGRSNPRGGN